MATVCQAVVVLDLRKGLVSLCHFRHLEQGIHARIHSQANPTVATVTTAIAATQARV